MFYGPLLAYTLSAIAASHYTPVEDETVEYYDLTVGYDNKLEHDYTLECNYTRAVMFLYSFVVLGKRNESIVETVTQLSLDKYRNQAFPQTQYCDKSGWQST